MWYRVFGQGADEVRPESLAEHLHTAGWPVEPHFKGDDLGWTAGELRLPGPSAPVVLDRYLAKEDDIRKELNAFAATLEASDDNPNSEDLMEHVALAQQLIVLRCSPDAGRESVPEPLLLEACRFFASRMNGIYQIDGRGWFAADGRLLVPEG